MVVEHWIKVAKVCNGKPSRGALLSLGRCSSLDQVSGWKALVFAVGTVQSLGSSIQGHADLALHGPMLGCLVSAWLLPWSEVKSSSSATVGLSGPHVCPSAGPWAAASSSRSAFP